MTKITRQYESIIIVNSSLHEDTLNRIVTRCEDIVAKNEGKLLETERWGKRRLAYPIKKFQYGFYIIFHLDAPANLIAELEREFRLNENILRFMTLVKDKKAIEAYNARKEREAMKPDPKVETNEEKKEESAEKAKPEEKAEETKEETAEPSEEVAEETPAEPAAETSDDAESDTGTEKKEETE